MEEGPGGTARTEHFQIELLLYLSIHGASRLARANARLLCNDLPTPGFSTKVKLSTWCPQQRHGEARLLSSGTHTSQQNRAMRTAKLRWTEAGVSYPATRPQPGQESNVSLWLLVTHSREAMAWHRDQGGITAWSGHRFTCDWRRM